MTFDEDINSEYDQNPVKIQKKGSVETKINSNIFASNLNNFKNQQNNFIMIPNPFNN